MLKNLTCIVCPNGCDITVEADGGTVISLEGAACARGREYAVQELTDPRRTIATSVLVRGGELPLVSVRLDKPIPKNRIFDVMKELRSVVLDAPVSAGDCVVKCVLGLDSDVIATKNVARAR